MVRRKIVSAVIVASSFLSCSPIIGRWISKEDEKSQLILTKSKLVRIYDLDTLEVTGYSRSSKSCDLKYMANGKADFILLESDKTCYEVASLSDSIFTYRHTQTGQLTTFLKAR